MWALQTFLGGYVYKDRVIKISGPVNVVIDGLHIINGDTLSQTVRKQIAASRVCAPKFVVRLPRMHMADGGGILAVNGANVTITRSSIYSNSAVDLAAVSPLKVQTSPSPAGRLSTIM